ncbi:MAG: winged helix DNA-binding domain-containing protein [Candidatus Saccharimonadales bacterium]
MITNIASQRLHNQHLLENLKKPEDVVRSLGAMQAQDFIGAKWAIGLRCKTTDAAVQKAFDDGKILRTHVLRPTWHFMAAEDIRWILELTAPRVHAFNKYYYKKLGVDEPTIKKANELLKNILRGGNQLTKIQIAAHFDAAALPTKGLPFGYILGYAELEALICSGAMQGKQHTYALLGERAPHAKSLPRDKALIELTRRFFTAHGPAQIADFAWWSSLTTAEIKQGVAQAKLKSVEIDGKTYYFAKEAPTSIPSPIAHLLPNYDEYFIAYKDRSAFSNFKVSRQPSYEDLSYHILAIDGQLAGGWKREITAKQYTVKLNPFMQFSTVQQKAIDQAAKRLSNFAGLPVKLA